MNSLWKDNFVKALLQSNRTEDIEDAVKLVRTHTQNLNQTGDFSCPNKVEIWQRVVKGKNFKEEASDTFEDKINCLKNDISIRKCLLNPKNGYLSCWLDRQSFMFNFFNDVSLNEITERSKDDRIMTNVLNLDLMQKSNKCQLTSMRCSQVTDFLKRLLRTNLVSPADQNCSKKIVLSTNDKIENAIKVGPVIGKDSKKKNIDSFLDVYHKFYKILDYASKERLVQSESRRIANVHAVVSAEIQFQLLSNNLGQPAIIDENSDKIATFVLYNHARIVQLLQSSKEEREINDQNEAIDVKLLTENEEWEIVFLYLSRYKDVLNDIVKTNDIKIGRLIKFLIGLSQTFSRYYNRVHVIKTAPHLKPTQSARLKLIFVIKIILEHGLYLLNIPSLGRM